MLRSSADLIDARNPDAPGTKLCFQGGLYAPTLRYHELSKTFYLLCTNIVRQPAAAAAAAVADGADGARDSVNASQNFWVTCRDLERGNWSDPVYFEFEGIDPSICFVGERAYVVGSRGPGPGTKINLFEVDLETGKKIGGAEGEKTLWEGELKFYPEGPHLYRRGGWWWLLIAEGGTHEGHCINVARSRELWGPYQPCPGNPVVRKVEYGQDVQCTGHMDLVESLDGSGWFGVCLGIRRRGEKGVRMTHGRETFLTKMKWPEEGDQEGWLTIEKVELGVEGLERVGNHVPEAGTEGVDLLYIREPKLGDHVVEDGGRQVRLTSSKADLDQWELPVSFVGRRQRLMEARSEVVVLPGMVAAGVKAGLVVYKDEHRFVRVYLDGGRKKIVWQVLNNAKDVADTKEVDGVVDAEKLGLQIAYDEEKYVFSYRSQEGAGWTMLCELDHAALSGSDFVGPVVGPFATGEEGTEVKFENWAVDVE